MNVLPLMKGPKDRNVWKSLITEFSEYGTCRRTLQFNDSLFSSVCRASGVENEGGKPNHFQNTYIYIYIERERERVGRERKGTRERERERERQMKFGMKSEFNWKVRPHGKSNSHVFFYKVRLF